ncbi:hypothetical protein Barb7_01935 [Bacteroidales bacterium Barb7]|nr:hypothetical protein Barb7_01935 [Bacteroidales bacterium Barb7]
MTAPAEDTNMTEMNMSEKSRLTKPVYNNASENSCIVPGILK